MKDYDIRLIGLDLDGTTLTTDKELTPRTKYVIEECLRRGIQVLPATGRAKLGIPDFLTQIEGMRYVLTSNGAGIVDLRTGETIYENGMAWDRALEIMDRFEEIGTYYDIYTLGCGYCEARFYDHLEDYNITSHIEKLIRTSRTRIETSLRDLVVEKKPVVEKINAFFKTTEQRNRIYEEMKDIPDIEVTYSLENNLEINHYTCNKGEALLTLGMLLGVEAEQIMAFGDGINDYYMIKNAGLGVAMENAYDQVKEVAKFVTKTNDEEGVAYAIEKFVLKNQ